MAEVEELRVQPQDILAEQSVLGAIFIDESKLVFVREYIESRDFFDFPSYGRFIRSGRCYRCNNGSYHS